MKKWYNVLLATINIILYLVIIALWISISEELTLNIAVTVFNLTLSMVLIFINRQAVSDYYQSQQFKKFTDTLVFVILIFCLLGIVNYWSYKHPWQHDFSAYKLNSLTEQSKKIVRNIKGEIKFKVFARKNESLLWLPFYDLYRAEKNDIALEKIDIDVRPDLVADYHINDSATLVIELNGKRQYVTQRDELNITNAFIKISRTFDPVVYFITGHGEADLNSSETEGGKFIFEAVKNSAVDIRPLNLLSAQEIPFDAKTIILWGPKTLLQPSEVKIIERFIQRKGNILIGLDPDFNGDHHPELRKILELFRITMRNDLVVDRKNFVNGSNGSIPLIETYNVDHPITHDFKGQSFFPLVSSLEEIPTALSNDVGKLTSLMSSSTFPDSWGEVDVKEIAAQKIAFTANKDKPGPLTLAFAYEGPRNKVVVFGNSTFVLNAYQKFGPNYSLFLNSLSWLVDEDRLISFNLPIIQNEPVFISQQQMGIIFYFSVLFSPLILFGISFYMYRRKRDK